VIDRQLALGLAFLGLIGLVIAGTVAQYNNAFADTVQVTVESDRAGLTLGNGAPVKLRGVEVGTVREVRPDGDSVEIDLDLDEETVHSVPRDVTAQIVPPTAFGAKYVQLTAVAGSSSTPIRAGDVIPADRVTVEIDEAFTNLTKVLDAARPNEVNNALTAVAGAVDGRGELIGRLITQVDAYLTSFNPSLRTLSDDLSAADDVLDTYDTAVPDLLRMADNLGTTSDTLVGQQASLEAFLLNLHSFSDRTRTLVRHSERDLNASLSLLAPVSGVFAKYSPELPCMVLGLASANELAEKAVGGTNPGITTITRIVPGDEPYSYPRDLPVVGDTRGPGCFGLPYVDAAEAQAPTPTFTAGTNPHARPDATPQEDALRTLFGVLAGGSNLP
jgi:phospholipid/cholesterol/gamma-HCH transport system substrate-binding protein